MEHLDLRIQKTYKLLIYAFEDLLNEKEFEDISVTEICDAAMIRRPTFYTHFLDKYDFLTFFIKHKMKIIFDDAFQKLEDDEENDFFVLVFRQLLNQFDNLLYLIFSLQMRSNIMVELEDVQQYGQKILRNYVSQKDNNDISLHNEYKAQIIMGITIQSVHWYKSNSDKISKEEVTELYEETLKKLR